MKLRHWSTTIAWTTAISLAVCIALLIFNIGLLAVVESYRKIFSAMDFGAESLKDLAPFLVFSLLAVALIASFFLAWRFERKVVRPLEQAIDFVRAVSKDEKVPSLSLEENSDEEMAMLFNALNVLHDRQQSLIAKSHRNTAHQLKMTRERDRFEQLKQAAFGDILADARRTLGILKGQLLGQLAEFDRKNIPEDDFYRSLLLKSIRRQGAVARAVEEIFDVNRLDWKRWNTPRSDRFDTADFIDELLDNARLIPRYREISLTSRISSDVPGRLFADRELLMQLLGILLRSSCRKAKPRSEIIFGCVRDERGEAVFEIRFAPGGEMISASASEDAPPLDFEVARRLAEIIGCGVELFAENDCTICRLSLPVGTSLFGTDVFTALPSRPVFADAPEENAGENSSKRVLLLDDDEDGVEVLTLVMRRYAVELVHAESEESMTELLKKERFDAVIATTPFVDRDPDLLLEKIRREGRVPVIFISPRFRENAHDQLEMRDRVAWLTMPLNYELLNEVIRRNRR